MGHPTVSDKGLEGKRNKLRTVVRDDTRPDVGELFSPSLNNDLDICFSHRFSNLKMDEKATIAIQKGT